MTDPPRPGPPRNPNLPHQVVITKEHDGTSIVVSCNCRMVLKNGIPSHDPIGATKNANTTKQMYNNPLNHWKPFSIEWELTYPDVIP